MERIVEEFLVVFERSNAKWLLLAGGGIALGLLVLGSYFESQVQFEGPFAPLTEVFRKVLHERYGKAALGVLGSSVFGAWKIYKRDRRKLLG